MLDMSLEMHPNIVDLHQCPIYVRAHQLVFLLLVVALMVGCHRMMLVLGGLQRARIAHCKSEAASQAVVSTVL